MKEIQLTKNKITIVDDEDYNYLSQFSWHTDSDGYARRTINLGNNRFKSINMHKELLKTKLSIDHINGDRLDNRKCNLREATPTQQQMNSRPHRDKKGSKYKGVVKTTDRLCWLARIQVEGKRIYLGHFATEELAAAAYDVAARYFFKDRACCNA